MYMACFYAMEELRVPFKQRVLFHAELEDLTKVSDGVSVPVGSETICIQSGTVRSSGELSPQTLYTLRVCKECRRHWLTAIRRWFDERPKDPMGDVPVRELGDVRMVSEEEWHARRGFDRADAEKENL